MNKPKAIGTRAEAAVAAFLRANGFPHAERRALRGTLDAGDITGCPGLCIEVKGGDAARNASDALIEAWLAEAETERINARANVALLVIQRRGVGPANAGRWWALMHLDTLRRIAGCPIVHRDPTATAPVRLLLANAVTLLRSAGWGQPLDQEVAS